MKRKNAALQMQQFVGEEKNDLLDYLRSLQPEQVFPFSKSSIVFFFCTCYIMATKEHGATLSWVHLSY